MKLHEVVCYLLNKPSLVDSSFFKKLQSAISYFVLRTPVAFCHHALLFYIIYELALAIIIKYNISSLPVIVCHRV